MDTALKNWGIALLCLALITLGTLLYLNKDKKAITEKKAFSKTASQASPQPARKVTLSFTPDKAGLSKGELASLNININTGGEKVSAVELILAYDPKIISLEDVRAGAFFPNATVLNKTIDKKQGRLSFAFGGTQAKSGTGIAAVIKLKGLAAGMANLDLSSSQVASIGNQTNTLKTAGRAKITVE